MRARRLWAAVASGGVVAGLVVAGVVSGTGSASAATPTDPGAFIPVTPANLLDTGTGVGAPAGNVAAHATVTFQASGQGGLPASGIGSVQLTIGVVAPAASGFATVYAAGIPRPNAASVNFTSGKTSASPAIVGVGSGTGNDGKVTIYNGSNVGIRLVANVTGYYLSGTTAKSGTFAAVTPANIVNTVTGVGAPAGAVPANGSLTFHVSGQGGLPASVGAAALVVGVVAPSVNGFATVYPAGVPRPGAAAVNFTRGQNSATLTEVAVGTGGQVTIFNGASSPVQYQVNVVGYYLPGPPTDAGTFGGLTPANLLDTATGVGAPVGSLGSHSSLTLQVSRRGEVPAGAGAAALVIGVVNPSSSGFVTVFPADVPKPAAATVNFTSGQNGATLVVVGLSPEGRVKLYNGSSAAIRIVANVTGYWLSDADTTGPSPVTDLASTSLSPTSAELMWHNPTDADFVGVKVCTNTSPSCTGSTVNAPATSFTATGLTANSSVTYTVFAMDAAGNPSAGVSTTVNTPAAATASISGTVTDVTSPKHGLGNVIVRAYSTAASPPPPVGAVTASDGTYTVANLAAGSYKVCFDGRFATGGGSATGLYQDRCYNNVAWPAPATTPPAAATAVTLTASQAATGIGAALPAAGGIGGTVTEQNNGAALGNVSVFAYIVGGSPTVPTASAVTAADGTYLIRHLAPAANGYIVCYGASAADGPPSPLGYADRCFKDFQWDQTVASPYGNAVFDGTGTAPTGATDNSAAITTGIDASLPRASVLSGTVTGGGQGEGNVPVTVWDTNGRIIARATTLNDGTWQAFPVSPGTVQVCFDASGVTGPSTFGYQSQCYNNAAWDGSSAPNGSKITLNPGTVVNNVNAALNVFPVITGTVTDGSIGLFNVTVKLMNTSGNVLKTTTTLADGTYALTHLTAAAYFVCFDGSTAVGSSVTGYVSRCYNNRPWDGVQKPSVGSPQLDKLVVPNPVASGINDVLPAKP